ncbi:helix-turn-helix transcriptional regulator [Streptomyces sp. NPDC097610]|uniref:helix-turn-helix domain-containing protein n=1 Tax=Streptomyces sp. NPDC097610 TaxID=3157227 RepID=UPI003327CB73
MPRGVEPSLNRRRLRIELRKAREKVLLTQQDAADRLQWSLSKMIRIEKGTFNVSVNDLRALLQLYEVVDPGKVDELIAAARAARLPSWWAPYGDEVGLDFAEYLGCEEAATSLHAYHPVVIPGLLQTADYGAALMSGIRSAQRISRTVELRQYRQDRAFDDTDDETGIGRLFFVVDEAALRRRIGEPMVMRGQLRQLKDIAQHPRVDLRVLPFSAGAHPALQSPFVLLGFEDDDDVLYLEGWSGRASVHDQLEMVARHHEHWAQLETIAPGGAEALALIDEALERFTGT